MPTLVKTALKWDGRTLNNVYYGELRCAKRLDPIATYFSSNLHISAIKTETWKRENMPNKLLDLFSNKVYTVTQAHKGLKKIYRFRRVFDPRGFTIV